MKANEKALYATMLNHLDNKVSLPTLLKKATNLYGSYKPYHNLVHKSRKKFF